MKEIRKFIKINVATLLIVVLAQRFPFGLDAVLFLACNTLVLQAIADQYKRRLFIIAAFAIVELCVIFA
jgi:hypothetical protein